MKTSRENLTDTDSDNDSDDTKCTKRKRKQQHRPQQFRMEWLSDQRFKYWLASVQGNTFKAKCKLCNVEFVSEIQVIKNHAKGSKHIKKENASSATSKSNLLTFIKKDNIDPEYPDADVKEQAKKFEIQLCGYLAEHNISFRSVEHLVNIIKNGLPDSKIAKHINLKRTKATGVVKNVIGESHKSALAAKLRVNSFSLLTDESTDISTMKTSCINVRFFDEEIGKIQTQFWELSQVHDPKAEDQSATAEHLFKSIIKTFEERRIPLQNIIGFGSDGCNVMMGSNNSVASRLKELCPGIFVFKCICHSIHICASEACKMLPRSCEDLARNIYSYFKHSAKRKAEFIQFQEFCDVNTHQMLHPSQTRWLSLSSVINRIVEQWSALDLYFSDIHLREKEKLLSVEQIYKHLSDPFVKLYFLFLQWVLPKFAHINQYFQSDKVVIPKVHQIMSETFKDLLCCYMDKKYILSTDFSKIKPGDRSMFLDKSRLYLGIKVTEKLNDQIIKDRPDLRDYFLEKCRDFMSTACSEIQKRYSFDDPVMKSMNLFVPSVAMAAETRDHTPSLLPLFKLLPRVAEEKNWQQIDDEWRKLPFVQLDSNIKTDLECDIFWGKLSKIETENKEPLFSFLSKFVLRILSLPHSNAQCERVFSKINLTKTKIRNKLEIKTVNGLLHASEHMKLIGSCDKFVPSEDMIKRMTKDGIYGDCDPNHEVDIDLIGSSEGINLTELLM